jgi:hypothetical protein
MARILYSYKATYRIRASKPFILWGTRSSRSSGKHQLKGFVGGHSALGAAQEAPIHLSEVLLRKGRLNGVCASRGLPQHNLPPTRSLETRYCMARPQWRRPGSSNTKAPYSLVHANGHVGHRGTPVCRSTGLGAAS